MKVRTKKLDTTLILARLNNVKNLCKTLNAPEGEKTIEDAMDLIGALEEEVQRCQKR